MKVLVISCHTDDIELAAGGMVTTFENVFGYVPTLAHVYDDNAPNTRQECVNSWKILGIKAVNGVNIDHHARTIDRQLLLDDLIKLRNEIRPDLVITHGEMDTHQSHQVVHQESIRAFKGCSIIGYSHPWNCIKGTRNNIFYSLSPAQVNDKLMALECYKSQQNRPYFNLDYQLNKMIENGLNIGKQYAEAFEVIRWIQ